MLKHTIVSILSAGLFVSLFFQVLKADPPVADLSTATMTHNFSNPYGVFPDNLIDDDISNLMVLQQLLKLENVTFTSIQDPTLVESTLAENTQIDIVFLDLEMPDLDGYEVLQLLKSAPHLEGVPIVAHTVHVAELPNARDMGFDSFISKPLDADNFSRQLKAILNGTPVWESR